MADEAWRFSLASAGLCCQFVPGQAAFRRGRRQVACLPPLLELRIFRVGQTRPHWDAPSRCGAFAGDLQATAGVSMSALCCSQAQVPLSLLSRAYAGTGFGDDAADWEGGGLGQKNLFRVWSQRTLDGPQAQHKERQRRRGRRDRLESYAEAAGSQLPPQVSLAKSKPEIGPVSLKWVARL